MRGGRAPLLAALAALAGCAHMEAPPGGPEDKQAPRVVATRPDTLARVPGYAGAAVIVFDERVSEQGIDDAVTISPRTSAARVDHSGDEIRVSLVRGWEPNRIYQIRVTPTLKDLFGNTLREPVELVFSTGPEIPGTRAAGAVVQRTTGQRVTGARVEAIRVADSLVYAVQTDSAGAFVFTRIPEGEYRLRAFSDVNRNRALDAFEARDTARLRVAAGAAAPAVRLRTLLPDTTPPRLGTTRLAGEVLEAQFDDFLDPAQGVTPAQVRITGPGGASVAIAEVRIGRIAPPDSAREGGAEEEGAPRDSAARATLPGRPATPAGRPAAARADTAGADTLPSQTLSIRPAAPLRPETEYRVTVTGVRNLNGLVGGGEDTLRIPAPRPAPAPAAAPRDTARVRPGQTPAPGQAPAPGGPPAPAPRPAPVQPPGSSTPATPERPRR